MRDYGTALWDGGDATCQHIKTTYKPAVYADGKQAVGKSCMSWRGGERNQSEPYGDVCGKCGAVRVDRQIGLEATPDEYLATMVQVFREVRRVLRRDGTVWCNMGDSYSGGKQGRGDGGRPDTMVPRGVGGALIPSGYSEPMAGSGVQRPVPVGCKPKDLLLMPARLALALQADGWWVRSAIVWAKPNPMPESVTDRPTSAHEHVFMLTRSARYYYDADAVREDVTGNAHAGRADGDVMPPRNGADTGGARSSMPRELVNGRNLRNVWTIATHAYPDAHFATFPPELAERCIKAGSSEKGCCAACGKPWGRITDTSYTDAHRGMVGNQRKAVTDERVMHAGRENDMRMDKHTTTTGWSPGCQCGTTETRPCVVLDPFIGAGTTALVADRLQRDCIGVDLNVDYTRMAMERCRADAPLLADLGPMPEHPEESAMADLFTDMAAD